MGELSHEAGATSARQRRTCSVLSLLVIAHIVFNLLLNPFGLMSVNHWWIYLIIGALFMEPVQLGQWAALGPGRLVIRLPLVLALLFLIALAGSIKKLNPLAAAGTVKVAYRFDIEELAGLLGIFGISALVAHEFARLTRCKLLRGTEYNASTAAGVQFSVKYLLILMTICAVALAIGRAIVSLTASQLNSSWGRMAGYLIISPAIMEVLLIPSIALSAIVLRRQIGFRQFAIVLFGTAAVSLAVMEVGAIVMSVTQAETLTVLGSLQAGAIIAGLSTAITLRLLGYRFVSVSSFSASKNDYLSNRWL